MAGMIQFTNNYRDSSSESGYQFEFYCDGCGTGCMSPFKASKLGAAAGIMRAASSFFGGMGGASNAADQSKDFLRGKERDEALREAVTEAKKQFKLCGRCGKWVCEAACWNEKRNMCEVCAPDLEEELASVQDKARVMWMQRKAMSTDMIEDIDITKNAAPAPSQPALPTQQAAPAGGSFFGAQPPAAFGAASGGASAGAFGAAASGAKCPCGATITGKFCPDCGTPAPAASSKKFCGNCGSEAGATTKFCGTCGTKL